MSANSSNEVDIRTTGLWKFFLRQLRDHPLRTKSIFAASVSATISIISQLRAGSGVAVGRVGKEAAIGFIFRGPVVHIWDLWLRHFFVGTDASKTGTKICKIMVDQMCCTPFFCLIYYHVKGMAAGLDVAKIHAELATASENYRVIPFVRHVRMSTLDLILLKLLVVFLAGKAAALTDPVSNSGSASPKFLHRNQ